MEYFIPLATLLLIACASLLIFAPLWSPLRPEAAGPAGHTAAEVEARYQAALAAIKDLMFDYEMGKVDPTDYQHLLTKSKTEAAAIRRQLDRLSRTETPLTPAMDEEIEALISQTRAAGFNPPHKLAQQVDDLLAELKNGRNQRHTCPNCQGRVMPGDAYSPSCGHAIAAGVPVDAASPQPHCPRCPAAVPPNDAFCAACGAALDPLRLAQANDIPEN
jgi:hypothetical protein